MIILLYFIVALTVYDSSLFSGVMADVAPELRFIVGVVFAGAIAFDCSVIYMWMKKNF